MRMRFSARIDSPTGPTLEPRGLSHPLDEARGQPAVLLARHLDELQAGAARAAGAAPVHARAEGAAQAGGQIDQLQVEELAYVQGAVHVEGDAGATDVVDPPGGVAARFERATGLDP